MNATNLRRQRLADLPIKNAGILLADYRSRESAVIGTAATLEYAEQKVTEHLKGLNPENEARPASYTLHVADDNGRWVAVARWSV